MLKLEELRVKIDGLSIGPEQEIDETVLEADAENDEWLLPLRPWVVFRCLVGQL